MITTRSPLLAERTTLRLGGRALAELCPSTPEDLALLPEMAHSLGGANVCIKVLGGGSNLLVADNELPFVLVKPLPQNKIPVELPLGLFSEMGQEEAEPHECMIIAEAGLRMPALLAWCAARGLSGLEGLVGLPGKLGGAVSMNAGAYGQCLQPVLVAIMVFGPNGGIRRIGQESWECGYRHFSLPGLNEPWHVISKVMLRMKKSTPEAVRKLMKKNMALKKATQPLAEHTAGCAFKNPEGYSAGKLLDECGLRGKELGGMRLSEKHANFLVNTGKGSTAAALELLDAARYEVAKCTGINLELEIQVWK